MSDQPPSILNQTVNAHSADEPQRQVSMTWQPPPPPPVYGYDQMDPLNQCRLSNEDLSSIFDLVTLNIFFFVIFISCLIIAACSLLYAEIYYSVENLLIVHLRKVFANVTKSG